MPPPPHSADVKVNNRPYWRNHFILLLLELKCLSQIILFSWMIHFGSFTGPLSWSSSLLKCPAFLDLTPLLHCVISAVFTTHHNILAEFYTMQCNILFLMFLLLWSTERQSSKSQPWQNNSLIKKNDSVNSKGVNLDHDGKIHRFKNWSTDCQQSESCSLWKDSLSQTLIHST